MRNSLLVEDSCADNERDLSILPKQRVFIVSSYGFRVTGLTRNLELVTRNYGSGRRALQWPAKGNGQRSLEVLQVIMPERVTIKQVRILFAESLRFPGEGKSAQG